MTAAGDVPIPRKMPSCRINQPVGSDRIFLKVLLRTRVADPAGEVSMSDWLSRFKEPTLDLIKDNFGDSVEIRGRLPGSPPALSVPKKHSKCWAGSLDTIGPRLDLFS